MKYVEAVAMNLINDVMECCWRDGYVLEVVEYICIEQQPKKSSSGRKRSSRLADNRM